jgi:hypothetical protein
MLIDVLTKIWAVYEFANVYKLLSIKKSCLNSMCNTLFYSKSSIRKAPFITSLEMSTAIISILVY